MEANELRIDNLIDRGDYHCKVTGITEEGIITEPIDYKGERFVEQIMKPIPLTEEWLVKFGFEEVDGNDYYKFFDLQEFRLFVNKKDNSCFIHYKQSSIDYLINNLHVHSLQNLYFALTGEELELI
jgi:hypothetical protein